jgi:zinc protease
MRRLFALALLTLLLATARPALAVTIERVVSPGGIEAWLVEDHANPILALDLAFRGGAALDPAGRVGLATMTAALLDEGAGPYSSEAFQRLLEDNVITLGFEARRDSLIGRVKTLSAHRDLAFDLLRLSLTQARFDTKAVERIRGQLVASLMREEESPNAVANKTWFRTAFAGHPYARPPQGEIGAVQSIRRNDLFGFAHAQLTRDRLVVGVVGDIRPDELAPLLDRVFGALPAKSPLPELAETRVSGTGGRTLIDRDTPQTVAVFGAPGIKRDDAEWYAATVMNYILGGGGFSSRLTEEVREKRGLAYSVYSYLVPLEHAGLILGGVATENSRFEESIRLIRAEFARMRDTGPSAEELANAKTYLNGSFPLQLDSTASIAQILVQMQRDHLGIDFLERRAALINAVGPEDVRRVAHRLLDPDALSLVIVGRPIPAKAE